MRFIAAAIAFATVASSLSACGPATFDRRPDVSTAPNAANQVPQSASSLPPGAQVSAPLTPGTGTVYRSGY